MKVPKSKVETKAPVPKKLSQAERRRLNSNFANYSQARIKKEQEAEAIYEKLLGPDAGQGWSRDGMIGSD